MAQSVNLDKDFSDILLEDEKRSVTSQKVQVEKSLRKPDKSNDMVVFEDYRELAIEFLKCGSLCHEVLVESKEGKKMYQSSSPDEVAICQRLKEIGIEFKGMNQGISEVNFFGERKSFELKMVSY